MSSVNNGSTPSPPPPTTTAESFTDVRNMTITGGVHRTVGGMKLTVDGNATPEDIERAKSAARNDVMKHASLLTGAQNILVDGANTESIGGANVTVTGNLHSNNPFLVGALPPPYQAQQSQSAYVEQTTTLSASPSNSSSQASPLTTRTSPRPKITATVGRNAKNIKIRRTALLSANGGGRVVGRNIEDVLRTLDKIGELEQKGGDREVHALSDANGGEVSVTVRAVGTLEVILSPEMEMEGDNVEEDEGDDVPM